MYESNLSNTNSVGRRIDLCNVHHCDDGSLNMQSRLDILFVHNHWIHANEKKITWEAIGKYHFEVLKIWLAIVEESIISMICEHLHSPAGNSISDWNVEYWISPLLSPQYYFYGSRIHWRFSQRFTLLGFCLLGSANFCL